MDTHDGANIASQVSSCCSHCQILARVESVCVDHEISIVFVDMWRFAPVAIVEEFWQSLALDIVDGVHVEPGAVAGQNDRVCLRDEVFARGILYALFRLGLRRRAFCCYG